MVVKRRLILPILLFLGGLMAAGIAYNALAVVHYDVDPVGVLANLLDITIPTLGYICSGVSILLIGCGIVLWRSRRSTLS